VATKFRGCVLSVVRPLVLGPAIVPEVTDPAQAEREAELAILSAVAHGNGPNGLAVALAALGVLGRVDREHAAVYFQIIWEALRAPMQRALEAKIMEQRTEAKATFPPFVQRLIEGGRLEGLREVVLRLVARAGIPLTEDDRARIQACDDASTLERWAENVLGAKTVADVLT